MRPVSPISSEGARESDTSSDSENIELNGNGNREQVPAGINANQPGNIQFNPNNHMQSRRRRRGRSTFLIPDVPNAPSESMAFFYSNLAKSILNEAGGGDIHNIFQPFGFK